MEKNGAMEVVEEQSLGRVQLRSESGEIILVPKPSRDPNDPLNWSVQPRVKDQIESATQNMQVSTFQGLRRGGHLLRDAHVHVPRCWSNSRTCPDRDGLLEWKSKPGGRDSSSRFLLHHFGAHSRHW